MNFWKKSLKKQESKKNTTPEMDESFETEQVTLTPMTVKLIEKGFGGFSENCLGSAEVDMESVGLCKDKEMSIDIVNTKENGDQDKLAQLKINLSIEGEFV